MFLLLIGMSLCGELLTLYYNIDKDNVKRNLKVKYAEGDEYGKQLDEDLRSNFKHKYVFKETKNKTIILANEIGKNPIVEVQIEKYDKIFDIRNISEPKRFIYFNSGRNEISIITDNETNLTNSISLLLVQGKIKFLQKLYVDTLILSKDTYVNENYQANNLVATNIDVLKKANATNKILYTSIEKSIIFEEDKIKIDSKTEIPQNISLMFTPYNSESMKIEMILPSNVKKPMPLNIYFESPHLMFLHLAYHKFYDVIIYNYNSYRRNATISFDFIGNWSAVKDYTFHFYINDHNLKYVNLSSIPSNIKCVTSNWLRLKENPKTKKDSNKFLIIIIISSTVFIIASIIVCIIVMLQKD